MNGVREVYIFDHINGTVGRVPIEGIAWADRHTLDAEPRYEALRTMVDSRIKDLHELAHEVDDLDTAVARDLSSIADDLEAAIGRPLTEPS